MLSIIALPSGFLTDILANVGTILTDLGGYLTLILGVLLSALVFEIILGAIRKH